MPKHLKVMPFGGFKGYYKVYKKLDDNHNFQVGYTGVCMYHSISTSKYDISKLMKFFGFPTAWTKLHISRFYDDLTIIR